MNKERYKEEYEEGSDLLWPSDKEDKITRQFYKDLSIHSKNINYSKKKKNLKNLNYIQFGTFLFMEVPLLLEFS